MDMICSRRPGGMIISRTCVEADNPFSLQYLKESGTKQPGDNQGGDITLRHNNLLVRI